MSDFEVAGVMPVLRCNLCNKPFDKPSTLKRHGYHCRSRKGDVAPRQRSCISCVKTKTRCDHRRPACSRCNIKGLDCQYPAGAAPPPSVTSLRRRGEVLSKEPDTLSQPFLGASPLGQETNASNGPVYSSVPFSNPDIGYIDTTDTVSDGVDWPELLPLPVNDSSAQYDEAFSPTTFAEAGTLSSKGLFDVQRSLNPLKLQILRLPTFNMPSIYYRQHSNIGARRVSQLMLQTLQSYPLMMMRQKTPPPFIHPQLLLDHASDDMEAWHNCMSLVHMIQGAIQGSRKLFWRNVRMECERFCAQYTAMNSWELLAAMQALAVYVIIRMEDGDKDNNNVDEILLRAVTIISIQLMSSFTARYSTSHDKLSLDAAWRNWIMDESGRRLCVLFQIINMLVHFEPAAMCEEHGAQVVLAPLPAQKLLWEASDEHEWKRKRESESVVREEFGLSKNGDLIRLDEDEITRLASASWDTSALLNTTAKWNEWCSGMDGLGGLVMLAACLIQ